MRVLVDDLGTPVRLPDTLSSVVSLVPSLTESVEATVPGVLVGATDYCVHPSGLVTTRVGGSKYPRVDDVIELRPQLVLANVEENRPRDVARLREQGVPVWVTAAPADVPAALRSLRRLCGEVFGVPSPDWLGEAEQAWAVVDPIRTTAIIPVWRKPWVVLGRDTFAGDVLRRIGVGNAFADATERYPRPTIGVLRDMFADGRADHVVLPDEPYPFTADDGPEAFPGVRSVLLSGRHLTWWGPSLRTARSVLVDAC
ncbi:MAG TPA: helical backbone metal receptor [Pseudonocardiaceae bacterium]|jgi:ABC-type Fe3+-hydroxamate transport system substrate-binding protein|nr:helical backbone metal receptor [Pseudonocardiaceae bacterium]